MLYDYIYSNFVFNLFCMDLKTKLGKRIRELRIKKNFTQEFLAEKINISPANYSRIENGNSYPKPENIEKICKILNVKVKDLFDFEHQKDISEIKKEIFEIIENDNEFTRLLYKFIISIKE